MGSRMQVRGEGIGRPGSGGRRGCSETGIRLAPMGWLVDAPSLVPPSFLPVSYPAEKLEYRREGSRN